jgi:hypothetical protein
MELSHQKILPSVLHLDQLAFVKQALHDRPVRTSAGQQSINGVGSHRVDRGDGQ